MEISLLEQAVEFALALMLGVCLGFLYDTMRIIRGRLPLKAVTAILDGLYWLACAAAVFWFTMSFGGGELRLSSVIAVILGVIAYFCLFSVYVRAVGFALADGAIELFRVIFRPIMYAVKKINKFLTNVFSFLEKWRIIVDERKKRRKNPNGTGKTKEQKQKEIAGQSGDSHIRRLGGDNPHRPSGADQREEKRGRRTGSAGGGTEDTQRGALGGYRL
jgi:hypothetical protein